MKLRHLPLFVLGAAIIAIAALGPGVSATPAVIDDFDDNSIGDLWTETTSGTGVSITETGQQLEFHFAPDSADGPTPPGGSFGDFSKGVSHECEVSGDFDVRVDFNLDQWPEENGVRGGLIVPGVSVQRAWDAIFGSVYVSGVDGLTNSVATSDTSGGLRISREDSTITTSYRSGGGWQTLVSGPTDTDPVSVTLRFWSHDHLWTLRPEDSADDEVVVSLDNLTLEEGNMTCGEVDSIEFTQAIQELQTIDELQEDLEDDGQPPVPMIAGKPAVLRVYFDQVDQSTTRTVQLTGDVEATETVTMAHGCDAEKRRKQEGGCKSVDFYFTPPEGEWEVAVSVYDFDGLREHYDFELESIEADGIVLEAVSVCDAISSPGVIPTWECAPTSALAPLASLLRKIAPTHEVRVSQTSHVVRQNGANYSNPNDWKNRVRADVDNLYDVWDSLAGVLTSSETYYLGMTRPAAPGSFFGSAVISGRGAIARTSAPDASVAHEVGHLMGLEHTKVALPGGSPGCWASSSDSPTWPYADNMLRSGSPPGEVEVGFDVAAKKALPGDKTFELMGYCHVRWISPNTTLGMLEPTGPLRSVTSGGVPEEGTFWLVSGSIDGDAVTFDPLFALETEGLATPAAGSFRVEVQDSGGEALFTRFFTPEEASADLPPGVEHDDGPPTFGEMIPVREEAARIVVIGDADEEIGAIALGGEAPVVSISPIGGGAGAESVIEVSWSAEDSDSDEHTYWVDYSQDGGETWQNQGMGLTEAALGLDQAMLAGSDGALIRVLASDGVNTGMAISAPFSVAKKLPVTEILFPDSGSSSRVGELVWLQGLAFDQDDGSLDDGDVRWSSSRDGSLGTGSSLPVYDLSEGTHTITMTAEDSDGNEASDSIMVTVVDTALVEGGTIALWSDANCSGSADPVDSLLTLRFDAGLGTNTGDCPELGQVVDVQNASPHPWGDVDCSGEVTPVDSLKLLRFDAGLSVAQDQGCPGMGTSVTIIEG